MPRGDKSSYSAKQKRQAAHIEEGYEKKGAPKKEAEKRAWATVNKVTGGAKKSKTTSTSPKKATAKKGVKAADPDTKKRSTASRSAAVSKVAATRQKNQTVAKSATATNKSKARSKKRSTLKQTVTKRSTGTRRSAATKTTTTPKKNSETRAKKTK